MTSRRPLLPSILLALLSCPAFSAAVTPREVRFERPDGAVLTGTFSQVAGERRPAVLLLHQAQASRAEFDFLLGDLHALGFHTLAVDLRGHGASSGPEQRDRAFFMRLFTDPTYAPPDVEAILEWLAAREMVDGERIAVMGGSVGANLAYVAAGAPWPVRTAVVLSGNADNADKLAARIDGFAPANVLLLATADDSGRDAYARRMFEQAGEPKKLEILEGSSAHGASMLRESEALRRVALEWLEAQLR